MGDDIMVIVSETKIVEKKNTIVKDNKKFFYLGKDKNGLKYFLDEPKFYCGWYYSFNNITVFTPNMRGILFTGKLGLENKPCESHYLIESVCDLRELWDSMSKAISLLNEFETASDPKILYDLLYTLIPNSFLSIEKLVCDTSEEHDKKLKETFVKQALAIIKNEIRMKEYTIRYDT